MAYFCFPKMGNIVQKCRFALILSKIIFNNYCCGQFSLKNIGHYCTRSGKTLIKLNDFHAVRFGYNVYCFPSLVLRDGYHFDFLFHQVKRALNLNK